MVTLIGEGITVDELAHHFGTIGYEVLTSLGPRYARIYKAELRRPACFCDDRAGTCRPRLTPAVRREVATFNIKQHQPAPANLLRWLRAAKPDVVALQELKSTDAEFSD